MKLIIKFMTVVAVFLSMPVQASGTQYEFKEPIKIVVPYPPGGTADFLVRRVAQSMSGDLKHPVIVENRPGASTAIAAASVSRAQPDGHTMMLASNATVAINQHLGVPLNYSPAESFDYVTLLMSVPNVIVVRNDSRYQTLKEMIEDSKSSGNSVTYGTMGKGTSNHLGVELISKNTKANLLHIPFKGSAPALTNLMGGHVDGVVDTLVATLPQIRAGKLRALATLGAERAAATPEVPTANEVTGNKEDFTAWFGFVVPKGTPSAAIETLNRSAAKAVQADETRRALQELGAEVIGSDVAFFTEKVRAEQKMYERLFAENIVELN